MVKKMNYSPTDDDDTGKGSKKSNPIDGDSTLNDTDVVTVANTAVTDESTAMTGVVSNDELKSQTASQTGSPTESVTSTSKRNSRMVGSVKNSTTRTSNNVSSTNVASSSSGTEPSSSNNISINSTGNSKETISKGSRGKVTNTSSNTSQSATQFSKENSINPMSFKSSNMNPRIDPSSRSLDDSRDFHDSLSTMDAMSAYPIAKLREKDGNDSEDVEVPLLEKDNEDDDDAIEVEEFEEPVDLDAVLFGDRDSKRNMAVYAAENDDNVSVFTDEGESKTDKENLFDDDDDDETSPFKPNYFNNPQKGLLDKDASMIPGSPFSKPPNKPTNRPTEPLYIAKYASTLAVMLTAGWIIFLLLIAVWNFDSFGRVFVELVLAVISFFGLFWNSYFLISSIFKCFIPSKAFTSNTKYCSIIPEKKPDDAAWLNVTIQIPVYKESLKEVMMPTLKSCIAAREHYFHATEGTAKCNIVLCDDGMMSYLKDNFPAAEMLWENIVKTKGQTLRLSKILKNVPSASRKHLKGLRSQNVYEVFHRMLYYYHYNIGFVARSTVDRRGKFKKASNLNSHLRLALGARQLVSDTEQKCLESGEISSITFEEALLKESHNEDGSRYVMFGGDIELGHLICINDADARMAESVIQKTVPEFLNDPTLGFTQHTTKTMNEQRTESYYTRMLTVYTDALYQGHFLLSSILGCHPPLVGHSIFLRTEALNQVGKMRTLRKAAMWLNNIGLQFLPVDQIGFGNLQAQNRLEYWSESHVSEDFELMIHLYNLGFNGRYCAYPDCEFQEGITRNFDEEAGRHRKFALGAHELVFNSFPDMIGRGVFTPLFRTFLKCDIPTYYKIFLTAYLCSYASGGAYIIVFTLAAIARLIDQQDAVGTLQQFSPAGIIILNFAVYYIVGYTTFLIAILRMNACNNKLLFPEYRRASYSALHIIWVKLRYCLVFQFLFYNVACFTYYFLGSMDHMLARPGIVGATNKDSINISRCTAFYDMARFNSGSWSIAIIMAGLAYLTILQDYNWDFRDFPEGEKLLSHLLFTVPAWFLSLLTFVVPIILNPWILGWPFFDQSKPPVKLDPVKTAHNDVGDDDDKGSVKSTDTFNGGTERKVKKYFRRFKRTPPPPELDKIIEQSAAKPDVEIGSLSSLGYEPSARGKEAFSPA